MATLPPYGLSWPASRDSLHVVSVGTCSTRARLPKSLADDVNMMDAIKYLAPALIGAISVEQDVLCRVLGDCVHGAQIDSEIKSLESPTLLAAHEQKFTYVRYDQPLDAKDPLAKQLLDAGAQIDDLNAIPLWLEMGRTYAAEHVKREHLYPRGT